MTGQEPKYIDRAQSRLVPSCPVLFHLVLPFRLPTITTQILTSFLPVLTGINGVVHIAHSVVVLKYLWPCPPLNFPSTSRIYLSHSPTPTLSLLALSLLTAVRVSLSPVPRAATPPTGDYDYTYDHGGDRMLHDSYSPYPPGRVENPSQSTNTHIAAGRDETLSNHGYAYGAEGEVATNGVDAGVGVGVSEAEGSTILRRAIKIGKQFWRSAVVEGTQEASGLKVSMLPISAQHYQ